MAKFLSYSYTPFSIIDNKGEVIGEIFRPMVTVKLSYLQSKPLMFEAIVDSGADTNLFPASTGEALGINFKKIDSTIVSGIGGVVIKVYTAKVNISILGEKFSSQADFSYEQTEPILGRKGFFNLFKSVTFKEKERFTEIMLY